MVDIQQVEPVTQYITLCTIDAGFDPNTYCLQGYTFALNCIMQGLGGTAVYKNIGTLAVPKWIALSGTIVDARTTTVGGAATESFSTGAFANILATDRIHVQLVNDGTNNVSVLSASTAAGSASVVFSANPGNDTIINILVLR